MFYKVTFASLSALLTASATAFYAHLLPCPEAEAAYWQWVQSNKEFRSTKVLEENPAHQTRRHVQKDAWTANEKKRSHFRLKSEGSLLHIQQRGEKLEITEDLQSIECCIQEQVDPEQNSQEICWITACAGTYFYPAHQFDASQVEIHLFSISGTELPHCRPEESCAFKFAADQAHFTVRDSLRLSGHVRLFTNRLQAKETFALADELTYRPEEGILFLWAHSDRRVLFWQDDLRMAATELQIRKDRATKDESVRGIGDVHFSFDLEEQQMFHEIFGRWL